MTVIISVRPLTRFVYTSRKPGRRQPGQTLELFWFRSVSSKGNSASKCSFIFAHKLSLDPEAKTFLKLSLSVIGITERRAAVADTKNARHCPVGIGLVFRQTIIIIIPSKTVCVIIGAVGIAPNHGMSRLARMKFGRKNRTRQFRMVQLLVVH